MRRRLSRILPWSLVLWLPAFIAAEAAGIEFTHFAWHVADKTVEIDLQQRFNLNETVLEALQNGVPLTFVSHVRVRRGVAWWEVGVREFQLLNVVRYRPLSDLYELHNLQTDQHRTFVSRKALLEALGELSGVSVIPSDQLEAEGRLIVGVKTYLDIGALPLPLRPQAYVSAAWHIYSGEHSWPLSR